MLVAAEQEIREYLPGETDFYLRYFEEIASALGPRYAPRPWNQHHSTLREKYLTDVENAAQRLKSLVPELMLGAEDFAEVRNELESLVAEIKSAEMTSKTRSQLFDRFSRLLGAIDGYRLTGAPEIQRAFNIFVGNPATTELIFAELMNAQPKGPQIIARLKKIAAAIFLVLGAANTLHDSYKNFAEPMEQLFLTAPASPLSPTPHLTPPQEPHEINAVESA